MAKHTLKSCGVHTARSLKYVRPFYNMDERVKRQPLKMVKHTETIPRPLPTNCLSVFDHFVGLVIKSLNACLVSPHIFIAGKESIKMSPQIYKNMYSLPVLMFSLECSNSITFTILK